LDGVSGVPASVRLVEVVKPFPESWVLAIDPGTVQSAWALVEDGLPVHFAISPNEQVLPMLLGLRNPESLVVIEKVESFGMPVGMEVFETVRWSGRFEQAAQPARVEWVSRRQVKLTLCHSAKANDASIRQALIDRYGGSAAIGRKATPGPLYGITKDVWSALALAVTHRELYP
jgi:hypothetical protein